MEQNSFLLQISGLSKSYSGVTVLKDVSLCFGKASIHGLIGENGAGKSTLIKCLNGITRPDRGTFLFDGQPYHPSVRRALSLGIVTIPQEFNLASSLSIRDNIFLGCELRRAGFLDHGAMRRRCNELLESLQCDLCADTEVSSLSIAQKQLVEIARALNRDCRLLIMDEPTTVLNPPEVNNLFRIMRGMRERGISMIYVSHKLGEVKEICDNVTVLRDGELICQTPISEVDVKEMANRMVGRELKGIFPEKRKVSADAEILLDVDQLSQSDRVKDVSFTLRKGEILGLAGLGGAGRTELAETLYGVRRKKSGRIFVAGKEVRLNSPSQAVRCGIAYLSEDRQKSGIIQDFGLDMNISLISLLKYCRCGFINKSVELKQAGMYRERFRIKSPSLTSPIRELSGGNQQKGAIAKSLDAEPRIFIFDEPTRGIDIQSRGEIYQFIHSLASEGMACIVISSDLEELIGLCPKVAVMREGSFAGFLEDEHINEKEIMYLATGVK
ncbi:MAG: sugar ABC transporter ATP-binding protein [Lentisphaeria bacterium]|nr:sugar ABC transporter ATP-binding protein [Lentisphaeria bacterium]